MKEKTTYRLNMERLNELFDHEMLTRTEIAKEFGCSLATVYNRYGKYFVGGRISKANLAHAMSI